MKQRLNILILAAAVALAAFTAVSVPRAYAEGGDWAVITWSAPEQVSGTGEGPTDQAATSASMARCQSNGGTACQVAANTNYGRCIAIAVDPNDPTKVGGSIAPTLNEARSGAASIPGRVLKQAMCAAPWTPAEKKAPPAAPAGADRDGDGLSDHDEITVHFTNVFLPDTDLDGVGDGDEVKNGTNPLVIFDN